MGQLISALEERTALLMVPAHPPGNEHGRDCAQSPHGLRIGLCAPRVGCREGGRGQRCL